MKAEFTLFFDNRPPLTLMAFVEAGEYDGTSLFVFKAGDENQAFSITAKHPFEVSEVLLRRHVDAKRCVYTNKRKRR